MVFCSFRRIYRIVSDDSSLRSNHFEHRNKMSSIKQAVGVFPIEVVSTIGQKLYLDAQMADVYFVFMSNGVAIERVPAHKNHLAVVSKVFEKMFNGKWTEKDEVKIVDATAAAFKEFLQFFYFDRVVVSMDHVDEVMNLGKKYDVNECLTVCEKFLRHQLTDDNVCWAYALAILFDQVKLQRTCEMLIGLNANKVLKSKSFLQINQNVLAHILAIDWLSCSEVELFEACMAWIKTKSNETTLTKSLVKLYLGNLFNHFRFGSMTFSEFASLIPSYGKLFAIDEYMEIIQMIADEQFEPMTFSANREPRCGTQPDFEDNKIHCTRLASSQNSTKPYFIRELEVTTFSVNEPLLLIGFLCEDIHMYCDEEFTDMESVPTYITIVEISQDFPHDECFLHDEENEIRSFVWSHIVLPKPILIRPGFFYEIRLKQDPPMNCSSQVLMKSEVKIEPDILIRFHRDTFLDNDKYAARGLIWDLDFCRI